MYIQRGEREKEIERDNIVFIERGKRREGERERERINIQREERERET